MTGKLRVKDIKVGAVMESTFWMNPVEESDFRFRATHLDGRRAPKVVLCNDDKIQPGVPCQVRVKSVKKAERPDRGMIEVEFVQLLPFRLEGVYLDPIASKQLQILLESGMNILLDGPQGCGKTTLARAIADALQMEFVFFNCSAVVEATDFLATIQVRASDSGAPVTDFIKTDLLKAFEEAGTNTGTRYLVFLDELNRCNEHARNALMPALDTTRRIFNPVDNTFLDIPPNVQFIAAVNQGSEFSGTFGIDAAQLDRFAPLQMDYLPHDEECKLLAGRHPELGQQIIKLVVGLANKIRSSQELSVGLSVRATDEVCVYLKHPLVDGQRAFMLPHVIKSSFCGRMPGRWNDTTTDAGAVWALVERTLRAERKRAASDD